MYLSSSSGSGSGLLLMDRLSNVLDITIVFSLTPVVFFFGGGCEYPSAIAIVETFCVQALLCAFLQVYLGIFAADLCTAFPLFHSTGKSGKYLSPYSLYILCIIGG